MAKEMVTIPKKEYDELLESSLMLECLKSQGVDNWAGYEDALQMFNEYSPEEDG